MKTLYLPVETAARELDGKLLLALYAAARGRPVVLGNRALLNANIHRMEPGIYMAHNFDRGRERMLRLLRQMGHHMLAWDEEGLVWVDRSAYLQRRVWPGSVGQLRTIFAWGPEQADALSTVCDPASVEVIKTGNPRADLLLPRLRPLYQKRVDELRGELGDFILINSNFGWLNYALAREVEAEKSEAELAELARKSRHKLGYLQHRYRIFQAILALIPRISAAFPNRRIIIRPHPSESPAGWREATNGLGNVEVRYDDELVPWLLAAEHIIHNGCTTAIEAALLDRATIMYRPVDGGEHEIRQPLSVSIEATTESDVIELLRRSIAGEGLPQDIRRTLDQMVITDRLSAETIAGHLDRCDNTATGQGVGRTIARAFSAVRSLEKLVMSNRKRSPSNPDYIAQKFPPTSARDIADRLAQIAKLLDLPVPQVSELSDRIFSIRS